MRKSLILPAIVAAVTLGGYVILAVHLHDQDTSFSGFLSAMMLNFWGGEQNQLIRVNLYNHSLALYQNGTLYKYAHVAGTGNPANRTATPTGQFRILSKEVRHVSGLSGVIMPLSMRFYEGYYFHDIPLTPSGKIIDTKYSHGCIRLPSDLAHMMYDWVNVGAYVEVYSSSLVRADDQQTVYHLTEDGQRQPISSERAFNAHGYQWKNVVVVPSAELEGLPLAATIY